MLCKKEGCPGDMKYFNRYGAEGYECPICHFKTFIHAHDLDLSGTEGLETFISQIGRASCRATVWGYF